MSEENQKVCVVCGSINIKFRKVDSERNLKRFCSVECLNKWKEQNQPKKEEEEKNEEPEQEEEEKNEEPEQVEEEKNEE